MVLDDDLTRWEYWWEFGKDPYLRLREAIYGPRTTVSGDDALLNPRLAHRARDVQRPSPEDVGRVAEALHATLRQARDRDTISACLVGLAKIGRDGVDWHLHGTFVPFLAANDQELRETAALALGIAGRAQRDSLDLLFDLVRDTAQARKVSGLTAVNERTRAFAAYGLGLLLQRQREAAIAHRIVETCSSLLSEPAAVSRDLKVAAIEALSLFPRDWHGAAADSLRAGIVDALGAYYERDLGPGEQLVQAHVPPAISRLLGPRDSRATRWKAVFATDLAQELDRQRPSAAGTKVNPHIAQSCALALGGLCEPWNAAGAPDEKHAELLLRTYRTHRDQQARSFALLALGQIGGSLAEARLLGELERASRAIEQPWCAVALGVLVARDIEAAGATGTDGHPAVTEALRRAFAEARNPNTLGALAISLGMCQDAQAADRLRAALIDNAHRDDLAGYLCIGLALMRDPLATGEVRGLMQRSSRRPHVMLQSARALGLLGDRTVTDELCAKLEEPDPSLVRLSAIASALGQIGDRRSIEPLVKMLGNTSLTPLTRAFAAVALGSVCDKDPLPWNAAYATHGNYRAATETLTDGAAGILDIL